MAELRRSCPLAQRMRNRSLVSLVSLVQHQEPLTPHGITEQVQSYSHTFLLQPQSSHLALKVSSSFFSRPLVLRLGYGLTALKLKEDFINKKSFA